MNRPLDIQTERRLAGAIQSLAQSPAFSVFVEWLKYELGRRDVENRSIERANRTTEAEALAFILEYVAACQSPGADRDSNHESGEESGSAASII